MRVSNPEARSWYLRETVEQSWDVRTLDRNISTQYYERLLMSQVKKPVIQEMQSKTGKYQYFPKIHCIKMGILFGHALCFMPDNRLYLLLAFLCSEAGIRQCIIAIYFLLITSNPT